MEQLGTGNTAVHVALTRAPPEYRFAYLTVSDYKFAFTELHIPNRAYNLGSIVIGGSSLPYSVSGDGLREGPAPVQQNLSGVA